MRHPIGKGYFVWQIDRCAGGDPSRLADMAAAANLSWVTLKIHNGTQPRNGDLTPHVEALRSVGVECWGWGYCYGASPTLEALRAAELVKAYDLAGYFVDAEKEYKAPGMTALAQVFMSTLLDKLEGKPVGLCAYRFPNLHLTFPWSVFLAGSDFHAPQVYWLENTNPTAPTSQLHESIRQLRKFRDLPFVPIGVASSNDTGTWFPTIEQINNFDQVVKTEQLPGVGWWSWQHAEARLPIWDAIASHQWNGGTPPVTNDHVAQILKHTDAIYRLLEE